MYMYMHSHTDYMCVCIQLLATGLTGQGTTALKEQSDSAKQRAHNFVLMPNREVKEEVCIHVHVHVYARTCIIRSTRVYWHTVHIIGTTESEGCLWIGCCVLFQCICR